MKKKIGSLDTYLDEYVLSLLETGKKSSGNSKFMCRQWNSGDLSISCTDAGWGKQVHLLAMSLVWLSRL